MNKSFQNRIKSFKFDLFRENFKNNQFFFLNFEFEQKIDVMFDKYSSFVQTL